MKNNRSFFLIGKEILKGFGKVVEMERVSLRGFFRGFFWKFFFGWRIFGIVEWQFR
jgi:hypothetical protein